MNVLTVVQGISVLVDWQVSSNVHQLWIENAIGSIGGGAVITSLLSAFIDQSCQQILTQQPLSLPAWTLPSFQSQSLLATSFVPSVRSWVYRWPLPSSNRSYPACW